LQKKSETKSATTVSEKEKVAEVKTAQTPAEKEKITEVKTAQTPLEKEKVVEVKTPQTPLEKTTPLQFKAEDKRAKERVDDTLKLLLRGEKASQSANPSLTADFSVATSKVIAPTVPKQSVTSLESLLSNSSVTQEETVVKADGVVNSSKTDGLELKLNESKQMIKYISSDVKAAIEDYKSPFTRVKVQLNPQKLGEIDLTVVQRGKNLHVNLSSNNAAINILALNANELKAQLNSNGINNASLNFNSGHEGGESENSQGHNQNSRHEREAADEYRSFERFKEEEIAEELISSLEIVVPRYI